MIYYDIDNLFIVALLMIQVKQLLNPERNIMNHGEMPWSDTIKINLYIKNQRKIMMVLLETELVLHVVQI